MYLGREATIFLSKEIYVVDIEHKPLYPGGIDSDFNKKIWNNEFLPRLQKALDSSRSTKKSNVYEKTLLANIQKEFFGSDLTSVELLTQCQWSE